MAFLPDYSMSRELANRLLSKFNSQVSEVRASHTSYGMLRFWGKPATEERWLFTTPSTIIILLIVVKLEHVGSFASGIRGRLGV